MKAKSQAILADTGTLQPREGRSSWRAGILIEASALIETILFDSSDADGDFAV